MSLNIKNSPKVFFKNKYQESLPPEYAKIFAFDNFARTKKHVLAKALDMEQGNRDDCIPSSSYVRLHIKEVPNSVAHKLCLLAKTAPVIASGLLQHESKMSVLHFRYIYLAVPHFPGSVLVVHFDHIFMNSLRFVE